MALVPKNNKGQFAQCATGAFDGYFRQIGANLQARRRPGHRRPARLGGEPRLQGPPLGRGRRRPGPGLRGVLAPRRRRAQGGRPAAAARVDHLEEDAATGAARVGTGRATPMYPGDDVVDLWGMHYYDAGPLKSTQAIWDQYYNATYNGAPVGRRRLAGGGAGARQAAGVGEWGIKQLAARRRRRRTTRCSSDNMYRFFRDNAASIAYETLLQRHHDQRRARAVPGHRLPEGGRDLQGRTGARASSGAGAPPRPAVGRRHRCAVARRPPRAWRTSREPPDSRRSLNSVPRCREMARSPSREPPTDRKNGGTATAGVFRHRLGAATKAKTEAPRMG